MTPIPAGLLRRLGAMIYDGLVVVALWMATLFPIVALTNTAAVGAAVQSLLFFELVAFFVFFWYTRGQTVGMLAWRIRLESATGHDLTPLQLVIRFFGALVGAACFGLGYFWILLDPERRSWADIVSQTRIVNVPREP